MTSGPILTLPTRKIAPPAETAPAARRPSHVTEATPNQPEI
jgi:hypothetical protein